MRERKRRVGVLDCLSQKEREREIVWVKLRKWERWREEWKQHDRNNAGPIYWQGIRSQSEINFRRPSFRQKAGSVATIGGSGFAAEAAAAPLDPSVASDVIEITIETKLRNEQNRFFFFRFVFIYFSLSLPFSKRRKGLWLTRHRVTSLQIGPT